MSENQSVITDDELCHELSQEELRKLACQPALSEFQRNKLEKDSKKNWDLFYKRNGDRFFKNRYWTRREFKELFGSDTNTHQSIRYLLEVGCGCGNFALPLIDNSGPQDDPQQGDTRDKSVVPDDMKIYCCDISEKAIELLKSNPIYVKNNPQRISAFVGDITNVQNFEQDFSSNLDHNQMDVVSLVFVLSALDPNRMSDAVANVNKLLRPGGLVLFRDYAKYDKAMLRFSEKSKVCDQFYVRQDGTRAYFFTKDQLIELFGQCHFECHSIDYIRSETVNNATKDKYSRIFLQAKFKKSASTSASATAASV